MMYRPRWQKVLADLWGNPTRSFLVVASITVGLFAIGVIANVYLIIAQDMRTAYSAIEPANIFIQTSLYNKDMLDTLREIPGVDKVDGVRAVELRVQDRNGKWKSIDLKAFPDPKELNLNHLHLVSGTWPPKENEIVIDQHKLNEIGADLGDMVIIERPSGKSRELKLVGIVQDLTVGAFSGGGGFFNASSQGYISRETMGLLEQPTPDLLSGVYLRVEGAGDDIEEIRMIGAKAADVLETNGIMARSNTSRLSGDHPNGYLVNAIIGVLLVLGLLVVFLSGFLITNTLQALLNQQIQQIGIMKTIGARRIQIAGVYIILIFGFGLIAFAIAQPLSYLVSYGLLRLLAGQLNFVLQGERVIWPVFLVQAGLALVMPQLAAWLPIWS
ncbi:MAG: ABC transporter permease, partial [Anaerolineaceae bacterium]|nr:ABC transporter permease [Anaerolineaceae bacterium]